MIGVRSGTGRLSERLVRQVLCSIRTVHKVIAHRAEDFLSEGSHTVFLENLTDEALGQVLPDSSKGWRRCQACRRVAGGSDLVPETHELRNSELVSTAVFALA